MANDNWDDLTDEAPQDADGPKRLREAYDRQKKELDKLRKEYDGLIKRQRQADVKSILEEVGVNPKVARFVLSDVEDVTKEAVQEWVSENGELFGISQGEPEAANTPPEGMSAEEASTLSQMQTASSGDSSKPPTSQEELLRAIKATTNEAELQELLGTNRGRTFRV